MGANLLPAVFGLIGVVVGGLITAGSSYLLESWREKRERAFELKRAARLMEAKLVNVHAEVNLCLRDKKWMLDSLVNYTSGAWSDHEAILAENLPDEIWATLVAALVCVESFYRIHKEAMTGQTQARPVATVTLVHLENVANSIGKAVDGLRRFRAPLR
jgi:hypothetical protein